MKDGKTPLFVSCGGKFYGDYSEIVELLLRHGANAMIATAWRNICINCHHHHHHHHHGLESLIGGKSAQKIHACSFWIKGLKLY